MGLSISAALDELDDELDHHWTADGLPRVEVVSELVGRTVTRSEITIEAPLYTRENRTIDKEAPIEELPEEDKELLSDQNPVQEEPVEIVEEESLETQLESLNGLIEHFTDIRDQYNRELSQLEQKRDAVILEIDKTVPKNANTASIQDYLAAQRDVLAQRGAVQARIRDSGVDLAALQKAVAPAPIDAIRKRR